MREKLEFHRHISEVAANLSKFARPSEESDRLFEATYGHQQNESTCDRCDPNKVKSRPPRVASLSPYVHYGTIASGNQRMRYGVARDRLAKQEKVICFEMEAAGLMDRFPCLVIRGICDYADSHKSKIWQPYAALTAAAFAKELLLTIPAADVAKARPADPAEGSGE